MISLDKKEVSIIGFGISGQAIANFCLNNGANICIYDDKGDADQAKVDQFKKTAESKDLNFKYCGKTGSFGFDSDYLMVSPGVPMTHSFIKYANQNKIPVYNDITLFLESLDNRPRVIGVTGSNGKSTTVSLLYKCLKNLDLDTHLVGNIGNSPLDIDLESITENTFLVIELSCYQLELFSDQYFVDYGIFTNITNNHLERYEGSLEKYAKTKLNMISDESMVVYNLDDAGSNDFILPAIKGNKVATSMMNSDISPLVYFENNNIYYTNKDGEFKLILPETDKCYIKGEHNVYNIMSVLALISLLDLDVFSDESKLEKLIKSIYEFKGLEHRIEFVREINTVPFINDSKATSPDAVNQALRAVGRNGRTILITGGLSKGMNYESLKDIFSLKLKSVVFLPGEAKEKIEEYLPKNIDIHGVVDMRSAVYKAVSILEPGDVVLLSPGTSSRNLFKDFEDRGEKFKQEVINAQVS